MQTTTQTNPPLMWAEPVTKLRINLSEYRFLVQAVEETALDGEDKEGAIQAIVCYAWIHLKVCLKDEATAYKHKLHTTPAVVQLTVSATTSY